MRRPHTDSFDAVTFLADRHTVKDHAEAMLSKNHADSLIADSLAVRPSTDAVRACGMR